MIPLKLSSNWRLQASDNSFDLARLQMVKNKDTGKKEERWVPKKFYGTVEQALTGWANISIRESHRTLPQALADAIKEMKRLISEFNFAQEISDGPA